MFGLAERGVEGGGRLRGPMVAAGFDGVVRGRDERFERGAGLGRVGGCGHGDRVILAAVLDGALGGRGADERAGRAAMGLAVVEMQDGLGAVVERDGGHRGIAVLVQCGGRGRGPDVAVRIVGDRSAFHAGDGFSVELAPPRGHGVGAAGVARGEGHVAVVDPLAERQAWILGRIVDGGRVPAGDFQADAAVVAQCRIVGADVQGGAVRRGQRELAVEHAGVERP